jgi:hypothetical protein
MRAGFDLGRHGRHGHDDGDGGNKRKQLVTHGISLRRSMTAQGTGPILVSVRRSNGDIAAATTWVS